MSTDTRDTNELSFSIIDRLMLLQDSSWSSIVASTRRDAGRFVATDLRVTLNSNLPAGYGFVGDRAALHAVLNRDLDALIRRAQLDGSRWNGETLVVLRPEHGPILLHGYTGQPDGLPFEASEQPAWMGAAQPDDLLFGLPFLVALGDTQAAIGQRHDAFYRALGPYRYAGFDLGTATLSLETPSRRKSYGAQIIGSYSAEYGSWCWSWANRSYARAPHSFADVLPLRESRRPGMGVLSHPGFDADEELSQGVALLAAELMGQRVVYRLEHPQQGVVVFFALRPNDAD